jgi:DNA-binding transcriptional regulator YiaG
VQHLKFIISLSAFIVGFFFGYKFPPHLCVKNIVVRYFTTKKYTQNMSGIKIIRDYFGLTQQELAVFLNVSCSTLSMAEIKQRLLPTHALIKLNLLDTQLQQPQGKTSNKVIATHIKRHTVNYTKQIQALHKELQYKTALHKKKTDAMQRQHGQAVQTLLLAQALQHKNSKPEVNKKDMAWLQLIEKKAEIALKNTHPLLQAHAQIKIDMLLQEAAALQALLQKIT